MTNGVSKVLDPTKNEAQKRAPLNARQINQATAEFIHRQASLQKRKQKMSVPEMATGPRKGPIPREANDIRQCDERILSQTFVASISKNTSLPSVAYCGHSPRPLQRLAIHVERPEDPAQTICPRCQRENLNREAADSVCRQFYALFARQRPLSFETRGVLVGLSLTVIRQQGRGDHE